MLGIPPDAIVAGSSSGFYGKPYHKCRKSIGAIGAAGATCATGATGATGTADATGIRAPGLSQMPQVL